MTRKDFEKFAKVVSELEPLMPLTTGDTLVSRNVLVDKLVAIFMEDNKNFSPSRFRAACEPERN